MNQKTNHDQFAPRVAMDDLGRFLIKGRYDTANRECYWTKSYLGAHDVFYRGFREGKGIWGTWEIRPFAHGGFHIWPKRVGEGETEAVQANQHRQDAQESEQGVARGLI